MRYNFTKEEKECIKLISTLSIENIRKSSCGDNIIHKLPLQCDDCIFGENSRFPELRLCGGEKSQWIKRNKKAKELLDKINNNFQLELFK